MGALFIYSRQMRPPRAQRKRVARWSQVTPSRSRVASGSARRSERRGSNRRSMGLVRRSCSEVPGLELPRVPARIRNRRGQGESGDPRRFRTQAGSDSSRGDCAKRSAHRASRSSSSAAPRRSCFEFSDANVRILAELSVMRPARAARATVARCPRAPPKRRLCPSGDAPGTLVSSSLARPAPCSSSRTRILSARCSPAFDRSTREEGSGNLPRQPAAVTCACSPRPPCRFAPVRSRPVPSSRRS